MHSLKKTSGLFNLPATGPGFLFLVLIACCVPCYGKPLFTENFDQNIQGIGRRSQYSTALR